MQRQSGFTLAEVLITLGIIAVVAAVTIPTLVLNNPSSQFKTAYKQSLSKLKQGLTMNVAIDDFDLRDLVDSKTKINASNEKSFASVLSKRLEGAKDITSAYFEPKNANRVPVTMVIFGDHVCTSDDVQNYDAGVKGVFECKKEGDVIKDASIEYTIDKRNFRVYQLDDGTAFGYNVNAAKCTSGVKENCVGFIDANGISGPNRVNVCDNSVFDNGTTCMVSNEKIVDIFPVKFYNQTVEPGSIAAKSILMGLKDDQDK